MRSLAHCVLRRRTRRHYSLLHSCDLRRSLLTKKGRWIALESNVVRTIFRIMKSARIAFKDTRCIYRITFIIGDKILRPCLFTRHLLAKLLHNVVFPGLRSHFSGHQTLLHLGLLIPNCRYVGAVHILLSWVNYNLLLTHGARHDWLFMVLDIGSMQSILRLISDFVQRCI